MATIYNLREYSEKKRDNLQNIEIGLPVVKYTMKTGDGVAYFAKGNPAVHPALNKQTQTDAFLVELYKNGVKMPGHKVEIDGIGVMDYELADIALDALAGKIYSQDILQRIKAYSKVPISEQFTQNYTSGEFAHTDGEIVRTDKKALEWLAYLEGTNVSTANLKAIIHELWHVENMYASEGENRAKVNKTLKRIGVYSGMHDDYDNKMAA